MGKWWDAEIWLPRIKKEIFNRCRKSNYWVQKIDVINAVANNPKYSAELSKIRHMAREPSIKTVSNMADWVDSYLTRDENGNLRGKWSLDFIADFNSAIERKEIKSNAKKQNGKNRYAYKLRAR